MGESELVASTRRGFRTGAFIALALLVAVPAVGGWWATVRMEESLADQVEHGAVAAAESTATQVEIATDFAVDFAVAVAHRPGFVQWLRGGNIPSLTRVLENVSSTTPLFRSIGAFDLDGNPRAQVPAPLMLSSIEAGKDPSATVFSPRPEGEDAILVVREPASDPGGPTVGVLVAEISLTRAVPGVKELNFGETGHANLLDREGRVLLTGESARLGGTITDPGLLRLVGELRAGTTSYFGELVGRREIAAVAPVEGRDWAVFVSQAEEEAFAPVATLRNGLLGGLAVLLLIGGVIAAAVSVAFARYDSRLAGYSADLERTNCELEDVNRTMKDFLVVASHDLRSPIGGILGAASILKSWETLSDDKRMEFLSMVERQGRILSRLVDDLLTIARLETGAMEIRQEVALLRPIIDQSILHYAATHHIVVRAPDDLMVFADTDHLHRIVANLVGNAVKYGEPPVEVEVTPRGDSVELRVKDSGNGIPDELVPRLFDKFTRATRGAGPRIEGSGLGLSIVQGLARANGGDVWLEPPNGRGACFALRIPQATGEPS